MRREATSGRQPEGARYPGCMLARLIGLIVVGLVVGSLGRLVHPGPDPMPIWLTIALGLGASIVAGILITGPLGFVLAVVIAAVLVGAVGSRYRAGTSR
jgi:uncharacterized membrane protein YeaQ/YmgE (transglycosylase-associated protein family)